jgi:hypothetical protein
LVLWALRGAEAPPFHGTARICHFYAACEAAITSAIHGTTEVVPFPICISMDFLKISYQPLALAE